MPPPPKKERRERSERTDKERPDGEGERANGEGRPEGRPEGERPEGRPEGERPERVRPEGDTPEKEKSDKEQPIKDKPDTEKDISPAVTKKPSSKKTRSVYISRLHLCLWMLSVLVLSSLVCVCFPPDPNQRTIRAHPVKNTAYSLANQQPRPTRTLTFPGV